MADTNPMSPDLILLADSNADKRENMVKWFDESRVFQVDGVSSGTEALEKIQRAATGYYKIILLDQTFDIGPNGLESFAEIRKLQPEIPLILFIDEDFQVNTEALEPKYCCIMVKPFTNDELISVIGGLLHKPTEDSSISAIRAQVVSPTLRGV